MPQIRMEKQILLLISCKTPEFIYIPFVSLLKEKHSSHVKGDKSLFLSDQRLGAWIYITSDSNMVAL